MTDMLIILGATALIFASAVVIFKLEHKALKEEFRAASADFNVQCSEAMHKLKEQNEKYQTDLAESVLQFSEQTKQDLVYTKKNPLEGAKIILEDNEGHSAGFSVKKVKYPE